VLASLDQRIAVNYQMTGMTPATPLPQDQDQRAALAERLWGAIPDVASPGNRITPQRRWS